MIPQFFFLVIFIFATSLAQIDDEDSAFDWLQFSKGTENDYVDDLDLENDFNNEPQDEEGLDIHDRSLGDYDLREALPYNVTCELQYHVPKGEWLFKDIPHPLHNISCVVAHKFNPLTHSRWDHKKTNDRKREFCIIKHQTPHNNHNLCQTHYMWVSNSQHQKVLFGTGCECHKFIEWYPTNKKFLKYSHHY